MFMIGEVSDEAKRLVQVTKECLEIGIKAVRPWGYVGDIGAAIQEYAHQNGYSVVIDFAGHGVGNEFHEDPIISHVGRAGNGMVLAPVSYTHLDVYKRQVYLQSSRTAYKSSVVLQSTL